MRKRTWEFAQPCLSTTVYRIIRASRQEYGFPFQESPGRIIRTGKNSRTWIRKSRRQSKNKASSLSTQSAALAVSRISPSAVPVSQTAGACWAPHQRRQCGRTCARTTRPVGRDRRLRRKLRQAVGPAAIRATGRLLGCWHGIHCWHIGRQWYQSVLALTASSKCLLHEQNFSMWLGWGKQLQEWRGFPRPQFVWKVAEISRRAWRSPPKSKCYHVFAPMVCEYRQRQLRGIAVGRSRKR